MRGMSGLSGRMTMRGMAWGQGGDNLPYYELQPGAAGQDTYLLVSSPANNYGGDEFVVARSGGSARNTLIKFDLSSINAGTKIARAKLYLKNAVQIANNITLTLFAILAANNGWTELGANWNTKDGITAWAGGANGCAVAGTDYNNATPLGSFLYPINTPVGTEFGIALDVDLVMGWLTANYGLVMVSDTAATLSFYSSDNVTAGNRPKLVLNGNP